jgi:hypothetical protein
MRQSCLSIQVWRGALMNRAHSFQFLRIRLLE